MEKRIQNPPIEISLMRWPAAVPVKVIAFALSVCLSVTQIAYGNIPVNVASPSPDSLSEGSAADTLLDELNRFASIKDVFIPGEASPDAAVALLKPEQKLVIYLEDAHGNISAQKNIAAVLDHLSRAAQIKEPWIAVEGTEPGEIDHRVLSAFPHQPTRQKVADYFLTEGAIAGEDYFVSLYNPKARLFGVDDGPLAEKNLKSYQAFLKVKDEAEAVMARLEPVGSLLKDKLYRADLKRLDQSIEKFESDSKQIRKHIQLLQDLARKNSISLEAYRAFDILTEIEALESKGAQEARIQELSRELDSGALFEEIHSLTDHLWGELLSYPEAREAYGISQTIRFYKKLFSFSLLPGDYADYLADPHALSLVRLQKQIRNYHFLLQPKSLRLGGADFSFLEKASRAPLTFYSVSQKRDKYLIENLQTLNRTNPNRKTFFIAGGFHTERIKKAFKQRDIPYLILTPKISDQSGSGNYWRQMGGDPSSLSQIFTSAFSLKVGSSFREDSFRRGGIFTLLALFNLASGLPASRIQEGVRHYEARLGPLDARFLATLSWRMKVSPETQTVTTQSERSTLMLSITGTGEIAVDHSQTQTTTPTTTPSLGRQDILNEAASLGERGEYVLPLNLHKVKRLLIEQEGSEDLVLKKRFEAQQLDLGSLITDLRGNVAEGDPPQGDFTFEAYKDQILPQIVAMAQRAGIEVTLETQRDLMDYRYPTPEKREGFAQIASQFDGSRLDFLDASIKDITLSTNPDEDLASNPEMPDPAAEDEDEDTPEVDRSDYLVFVDRKEEPSEKRPLSLNAPGFQSLDPVPREVLFSQIVNDQYLLLEAMAYVYGDSESTPVATSATLGRSPLSGSSTPGNRGEAAEEGAVLGLQLLHQLAEAQNLDYQVPTIVKWIETVKGGELDRYMGAIVAMSRPGGIAPGRELRIGENKETRVVATERIGFGNMGHVWALHWDLTIPIVGKHLPGDNVSAARAGRHGRESGALALLGRDQSGLFPKYFGRSERDPRMFAMERILGLPLRDLIELDKLGSVKEKVELFMRLMDALPRLRIYKMVHRDIKPSNIMVSKEGNPTLTDFGLAKGLEEDEEERRTRKGVDRTITEEEGADIGTPQYMAPELLERQMEEDGTEVREVEEDAMTDLWSASVTFLEMLVGKNPFAHRSKDKTKYAVVNSKITVPRFDIPRKAQRRLRRILLRALHKDRRKRYQSAEDMQKELRALLALLEEETSSNELRRFLIGGGALIGGLTADHFWGWKVFERGGASFLAWLERLSKPAKPPPQNGEPGVQNGDTQQPVGLSTVYQWDKKTFPRGTIVTQQGRKASFGFTKIGKGELETKTKYRFVDKENEPYLTVDIGKDKMDERGNFILLPEAFKLVSGGEGEMEFSMDVFIPEGKGERSIVFGLADNVSENGEMREYIVTQFTEPKARIRVARDHQLDGKPIRQFLWGKPEAYPGAHDPRQEPGSWSRDHGRNIPEPGDKSKEHGGIKKGEKTKLGLRYNPKTGVLVLLVNGEVIQKDVTLRDGIYQIFFGVQVHPPQSHVEENPAFGGFEIKANAAALLPAPGSLGTESIAASLGSESYFPMDRDTVVSELKGRAQAGEINLRRFQRIEFNLGSELSALAKATEGRIEFADVQSKIIPKIVEKAQEAGVFQGLDKDALVREQQHAFDSLFQDETERRRLELLLSYFRGSAQNDPPEISVVFDDDGVGDEGFEESEGVVEDDDESSFALFENNYDPEKNVWVLKVNSPGNESQTNQYVKSALFARMFYYALLYRGAVDLLSTRSREAAVSDPLAVESYVATEGELPMLEGAQPGAEAGLEDTARVYIIPLISNPDQGGQSEGQGGWKGSETQVQRAVKDAEAIFQLMYDLADYQEQEPTKRYFGKPLVSWLRNTTGPPASETKDPWVIAIQDIHEKAVVPGKILPADKHGGTYVVTHPLEEGSMGSVLKAIYLGGGQTEIMLAPGDPVVIKTLLWPAIAPQLAVPPGTLDAAGAQQDKVSELKRRFRIEARVLGSASHDTSHLPTLFGYHDTGDLYYIAMAFIPGVTLDKFLKELNPQGGPLNLEQLDLILHLFLDMVDGLTPLHRRKVTHRDLKPSNVMITEGSLRKEAVVADLGLVEVRREERVLGGSGTGTGLDSLSSAHTEQGYAVGTPYYLSNEAINDGVIGPPTDFYSLAVMLYDAITGEDLFTGDGRVEVLNDVLRKDTQKAVREMTFHPAVPPGMKSAIRDFLTRNLNRDTTVRTQSADELMIEIQHIKSQSAIFVKRIPPLRIAILLVVGAVIGFLLALLMFFFSGKGDRAPSAPAPEIPQQMVPMDSKGREMLPAFWTPESQIESTRVETPFSQSLGDVAESTAVLENPELRAIYGAARDSTAGVVMLPYSALLGELLVAKHIPLSTPIVLATSSREEFEAALQIPGAERRGRNIGILKQPNLVILLYPKSISVLDDGDRLNVFGRVSGQLGINQRDLQRLVLVGQEAFQVADSSSILKLRLDAELLRKDPYAIWAYLIFAAALSNGFVPSFGYQVNTEDGSFSLTATLIGLFAREMKKISALARYA